MANLGRGPLAAVLCYLLLIFPALGFVDVYPFRFSFVADHFQYLAGIPLIVLRRSSRRNFLGRFGRRVNATAGRASRRNPRRRSRCWFRCLLVVLGAAAWIRADVFSEPAKLWQDVLQADKNPDSWLAAYNLARSWQSDAKLGFDEADRLLQGGDRDSAKHRQRMRSPGLDNSDLLLKAVLGNPGTPDDVRYKAHDLSAQNDVTRLRSPDSDSTAVLSHALEQLKLAMASPRRPRDPLPYYTLGIVDRNLAEALHKESGPTTRPTEAGATTRPNTPTERRFIDLYLEARDNFREAGGIAEAGLNSSVVGPESAQVLPLAALQSGDIDWQLAALAHEHADAKSEIVYSHDAVVDYGKAANLNPTNAAIRYQLALALENVDDLNGAKEQLMVILRDLDHYNAAAYNEIGRVILESRPTDMAEFQAAVESFKTAIKLNPNLVGAQKNLAMAMRMLASTRPATRSSTGPSTKP